MFKQILLLLTAVTACVAFGKGTAFESTKNVYQKQAPQQYASVVSHHSASQQPQRQPQAAPSPYSFSYAADAPGGGGSAREESSDDSGAVKGSYTVTNDDGTVRVVKYIADHMGFRADVDTNEAGTKSSNPADVAFKSAAVEAPAAPKKYATQGQAPRRQFQQKTISLGSGGAVKPSPYSFNYESQMDDGSSAHSETSDGSGKVTGSYSMSVSDGRHRKVDYSADTQGFRASVDTNEFGTRSASPADVKFLSSAPQEGPAAASFAKSTSYQQKQTKKYSHSMTKQEHVQQPIHFADAKPSPYSFNYDAQLEDGSSSRSESSDGSGKVVGSYSLSGSDGRQRTIDYEADQGGFRASVNTNEFGTRSDSPADVKFYSSAVQDEAQAPRAPTAFAVKQKSRTSSSHFKSVASSAPQHKQSYQGQSSVNYEARPAVRPSPFDFNYFAQLDDGSSSRQESADESGKVTGSYSLSVADGRQRTVDYSADHEGFRASVNTNEFGTKGDSPADVQFYSSATFDEPAPYMSPNANKAYSSAPSVSQHAVQAPIQYAMDSRSGAKPYSFNYDNQMEDGGSSAHSESSDGSGKVTGYYSMSVADGRRRKVDYSADNQGFKAAVDTNEFGTKSDSPADVRFMSSAPVDIPRISTPTRAKAATAHRPAVVSQQRIEQTQHAYVPYSFNYEAEATGGSSARQEETDASGKVTGSYTVRNEDGSIRVVEYIADENGFRANVKTNEQGTKSDSPADVTLNSDAPVAPVRVQQSHMKAQFPDRSYTPKTLSQKPIDNWRR